MQTTNKTFQIKSLSSLAYYIPFNDFTHIHKHTRMHTHALMYLNESTVKIKSYSSFQFSIHKILILTTP